MADPRAQQAMFRHLRSGLESCEAKERYVLPGFKNGENVFEQFMEQAAKIYPGIFDEDDAWSLVLDALLDNADEFRRRNVSMVTEDGRVATAFVDAAFQYVAQVLEGLPYTFVVTFPLPRVALPAGSAIELSKGVTLHGPEAVEAAADNDDPLAPRRVANALLALSPRPSELRVLCTGFASIAHPSLSHTALRTAYSTAKRALIGGYVTGVFDLGYERSAGGAWKVSFWNANSPNTLATVVATRTSGWHTQWELRDDAGAPLGLGFLSQLQDDPVSNISARLSLVKRFLATSPETPDTKHIAAASEWYFDALQQSNQTLEFVQVCTAIEAILGSNTGGADGYGITKQLADRCAFLLASTRSSRDEMRDLFLAMYKSRSNVVHGIDARLPKEAQKHRWQARRFLDDLLRKELANVPDQRPAVKTGPAAKSQ